MVVLLTGNFKSFSFEYFMFKTYIALSGFSNF